MEWVKLNIDGARDNVGNAGYGGIVKGNERE